MPSIVREVTVDNLLSGFRYLVEWTLNSSTEVVTAYEIWRSTQEYQGFEKIAEVASPMAQYIDKVPYTFGVVYFYKVIARDNTGLRSDIAQSNPVSDMTFDDFEEKPFRATTVSFDSFATGEIPTGVVNGSNASFATSSYFRFGTVEVFVNGVARVAGVGFSEGNDQKALTLTPPPAISSTVMVNYRKV